VIKPGDDATVIRVDDETAFTITSDCNSSHTKLNPYHGGAGLSWKQLETWFPW
jgi:phosphoribosylformylglycinamidine synthase